MKYLIYYNIVDNRKRTRLFKKLKDYGIPVQKSVFECILTNKQIGMMWKEIEKFVSPDKDIMLLYKLDVIEDAVVCSFGFYIPREEDDELIFI